MAKRRISKELEPSLFPELEERAASPIQGELFGEDILENIAPPFDRNLLADELEGLTFGGSLSTHRKPRRRRNSYQADKWKGKEQSSREKRNTRLWASLYPTPSRNIRNTEK